MAVYTIIRRSYYQLRRELAVARKTAVLCPGPIKMPNGEKFSGTLVYNSRWRVKRVLKRKNIDTTQYDVYELDADWERDVDAYGPTDGRLRHDVPFKRRRPVLLDE